MANRNIVAIGASAGGVEALRFLTSRLAPDFDAAVFVTLHLSRLYRSELDGILSSAGPLPAAFAKDGDPVKEGHIYLAPPDRHLIVEGRRVKLGLGPQENHSRPAIDPMLRSTAICCGFRSIGLILTGSLSDGSSGLQTLGTHGGITVVQDPTDATVPDMPLSAMNRMEPDYVVPLSEMPALLAQLTLLPAGEPIQASPTVKYEVDVARTGRGSIEAMDRIGRRSVQSCPDCGGVMWELKDGNLTRYRCHVGHAYNAEHLSVALDESVRHGLSSAARALEERIALAHKLAAQAAQHGRKHLAESWAQQERESMRELRVIRESMVRMDQIAPEASDSSAA